MPRQLPRIALICLVSLIVGARATEPRITPLQQLFVLKEIKPDLERVGIIWNEHSATSSGLLEQLNRASASTGVRLFIAYANELQDIAPRYRDLIRQNDVQAIWVLDGSDPVVTSRIGREFLIKQTASQGIPLVAPSDDWVEAGAHLSFHHDGDGVRLKVNKRSADAAALTIPDSYMTRTEFLAAN